MKGIGALQSSPLRLVVPDTLRELDEVIADIMHFFGDPDRALAPTLATRDKWLTKLRSVREGLAKVHVICRACNGSGIAYEGKIVSCQGCKGDGWVRL